MIEDSGGFLAKPPHIEKHFTAPEAVRDAVIGMSDGLTVPFALAAGLSGAVASSKIVVLAGLAEIAAGSIAMGLGGYLAARTDAEHYQSERRREVEETQTMPREEVAEVEKVFASWGISEAEMAPAVDAITRDETRWVDFMMRYELGLEEPAPGRAVRSAGTIAIAYIVGGFVPLAPYMLTPNINDGLLASVVVTIAALFVFGFLKARYTALNPWRGGFQTMLIGGLAATAAFLIARVFR
jgi:VIT1/CCC1 family predicted Fe2+/Mn2+ transporter